VAGALLNALGGFAAGINSIIPTMQGFRNPEVIARNWEILERYKVSIIGAIPTSIAAMSEVPLGSANISSLRYMISGGATMPLNVAEDIEKLTGRPIYQIYGMTETAGTISMPDLENSAPPGGAGHVSGEVEILIDTESNDDRAVGEICVRGPMVFPGYLGSDESPLEDGWLRTGDLGYIDTSNNIFITGRAKDLIIRSGHNIDPDMIESCLETHPAVFMAAAVGVPDAYAGELPVAFVQLHRSKTVTTSELKDYTMTRISERPAAPKSVVILKTLPITAVGKIHKPTLRAMAIEDKVRAELNEIGVENSTIVKTNLLAGGGVQVTVLFDKDNEELTAFCSSLGDSLGLKIVLEKVT